MNTSVAFTRNCCALFFTVLSLSLHAQQKPPNGIIKEIQKVITPKKIDPNNKQPPLKNPPTIKKDTTYHVQVIPTTAITTFATEDQLFIQGGDFVMQIANNYRYLSLRSGDPAYNDIPIINAYIDNNRQNYWKFIPNPDGYYQIQTQNGRFLAAVFNDRIGRYELRVEAGTTSRLPYEMWQLQDLHEGLYKIVNKQGMVLALSNVKGKDGDSLSLPTGSHETYEERWHLIKMTNDGRKLTNFDPVVSGFHFVNTFGGYDFIRWGGLCGGMVYSALDYFHSGIPIPTQSWTPPNQSTLQSYLFARQQHSMSNVNEKWSELEVSYNTRGSELFRWGIQGTGGGRLEQLKNFIDAGVSVPIGLFVGGVGGLDRAEGGNHVMLAIGYALGRGFANHPEDYKIFAYDPNMRNRMVTLVPYITGQCFMEVESGKVWRTYFVNDRYNNDHTPPADIPNFPEDEPDGTIRNLYADFITGNDDLSGDRGNVDLVVQYTDGTTQMFANINSSSKWTDGTIQTVHLALNRPVHRTDVRGFQMISRFGSDLFSDEWKLTYFRVTPGLHGEWFAVAGTPPGAEYLFKFSGRDGRQVFFVPAQR